MANSKDPKDGSSAPTQRRPYRKRKPSDHPLTPRQARFVAEYPKDGNGKAAAIRAGYSPKGAQASAHELLYTNPKVKAAIEKTRQEILAQGTYNLQAAMDEAQETIQFARETENANAMAKAVELRAKLNGLLIERHDVRQVGFSINISGMDDPPTPDAPSVQSPNEVPNEGSDSVASERLNRGKT